jgi:hypothetical protein
MVLFSLLSARNLRDKIRKAFRRKMTGLYFIAAGNSSNNRKRSLDSPLEVGGLMSHLDAEAQKQMRQNFEYDERVFAWGATRAPRGLKKLDRGDYVVDTNNKSVVWIFEYEFLIEPHDAQLQNWIGWNERYYKYVYFLSKRQPTSHGAKAYFQTAFAQEGNPHWLAGQRWFSDYQIQGAINKMKKRSIEELLGIES